MKAAADRGAWSRDALDRCDDRELVGKVQSLPQSSAGREAAYEVLIVRYRPLVRSCALRYRESPETTEELMQAGYVGLLKAINNFDPAIGTDLAAYARPCISGEIKRHFRDTRWHVHVTRSAQELRLAARNAAPQLAQELSRTPRDDELARRLKVSEQDIADARHAETVFQARSLDAPVAGGQEDVLADLMGEEDTQIEHTVQMQAVAAHWGDLPAREQRILLLRFYGNMSQAEIGEQMGMSQMHVSRLLARALSHLRACLYRTDGEASREAVAAGGG
jgi:RNA polymerase sigma-B factor